MEMLAIGVAIGLALAASGWTLTKVVSWIEAKIKVAEATAAHTIASTAALAPTGPSIPSA
jgi:hypothetical protein